MSLTVLSDDDIRNILESLTSSETEALADRMRGALREYSTGTQNIDVGSIHQPERTVVHSDATNATTLFMPSINEDGHAVKVVTLSGGNTAPDQPALRPTGSVTVFSPQGAPTGFLHAKTLTAFRTALASSCLLTKRQHVKTLTVFGSGLQAYWHVRLALLLRGEKVKQVYVINRQFSDSARDILAKFYAVDPETRRREGWADTRFSVLTPSYGEYERLTKDRRRDILLYSKPRTPFDPTILTNTNGRRKGRLIVAIGSYKPEMREIPREVLEQAIKGTHGAGHIHFHKHATEGGVVVVDTLDGAMKEAGEIIEAGVQPNQMVELGELVMIRKAAEEEDSIVSMASPASTPSSTADISSDLDKLDIKSGSSAMSSIYGRNSTEAGSFSNLEGASGTGSQSPKRSSSFTSLFSKQQHRRSSSQGSSKQRKQSQSQSQNEPDHLARWLTSGNVIYKSVGLGLMDLVVGNEIIRLAKEKGVGHHIENFS
ncbi:UbiD family decarboxylase [Apiospora kogelbergensis]|uniref:UbiD family decarboxylase n=1 Tax=Apiospora kogelbergensis TaxID=1337665 RepID=UPI00312DCE00